MSQVTSAMARAAGLPPPLLLPAALIPARRGDVLQLVDGEQAWEARIPVHAVDEHGDVGRHRLVEHRLVRGWVRVVVALVEVTESSIAVERACCSAAPLLAHEVAAVEVHAEEGVLPLPRLHVGLERGHLRRQLLRSDHFERKQLEDTLRTLSHVAAASEGEDEGAEARGQALVFDPLADGRDPLLDRRQARLHVAEWRLQQRRGVAVRQQALPQALENVGHPDDARVLAEGHQPLVVPLDALVVVEANVLLQAGVQQRHAFLGLDRVAEEHVGPVRQQVLNRHLPPRRPSTRRGPRSFRRPPLGIRRPGRCAGC